MMIEAAELANLPGIRHAFFTREEGVSEGIYASLNGGLGSADAPDNVAENRRRMAGRLGLEARALLSLHQIHSPLAVTVTSPWAREDRPKADGMACATPGLALAIATADCGPILFADAEARVVGACHAGWKGAFGGVLEATVEAMEALGARRERTVAVLGPTIGRDAYEVGPEFRERFAAAEPAALRHFRPSGRDGHSLFDLPAYIAERLRRAGLGTVADLGLCTYSDERRFFSYRRTTHRGEGDYGRLISAIALAPA
ncbi:MAG: peptidoglycan editing factor PgeF [Methylobacteriaceae bacterium]|nr:peptidoglycan editing factor PgeF [Methylobacteriaceae bacterium]